MKKKNLILVAFATILFASCAEEIQPGETISDAKIGLNPAVGKVDTRAAETTTANLNSFQAYSFVTDDNINYMDGVTYTNASGQWNTTDGSFYWPGKGNLNFYCYAPATPGESGSFAINPSTQKLNGFSPYATAATQQDLIYAKATGNLAANATSGLDVNFKHALSEITIAAKNTNTAYTVEVTGVKLGNIISKGDFTFPTVSGADAAWSLASEKDDYTTEWTTAKTLGSESSTMDVSNVPFMLVPQQLSGKETASQGNYIAMNIKVMQNGNTVYEGWAYAAISTLWEMNKRYDYTVDFSNGFGQKEDGEPIVNLEEVIVSVNVRDWSYIDIELPLCISGYNLNNKETTILSEPENVLVTMFDDNTWKYEVKGWKPTRINFSDMPSLKTINLSSLDASNIEDMSNMFFERKNLTTVKMAGVNFYYVTDMENMFSGCSSLTSLDLLNGAGINTNKGIDMTYMFAGCSSLETIDISRWNLGNYYSHNNMTGMFKDCTSLKRAEIRGSYVDNTCDMFNGCKSLKYFRATGSFGSATDMSSMFEGCSNLTQCSFINTLICSSLTTTNKMFYGCSSLKNINLYGLVRNKVTDISQMFAGCSSLTSLDLSWNTSNVENMNSTFAGCSSLTSLDLSGWNTEKLTDMDAMFAECNSLETLNLSGWNTNNVTKMSGMFYHCNSLETLDLSNWNFPTKALGGGWFSGCTKLKNIYMVGCNDHTIEKVKQELTNVGLSTDIIKTTR